MSGTGHKRVASKDNLISSLKKRRSAAGKKQPPKTKVASGVSVANLTADELAWKEVIPPDRLDDAEGFFGLEENDDVDVVRDVTGKQARFRVWLSTTPS